MASFFKQKMLPAVANQPGNNPKVAALKKAGYGGPGTVGYQSADGVIGFDGQLIKKEKINANSSLLSSPFSGNTGKMGG